VAPESRQAVRCPSCPHPTTMTSYRVPRRNATPSAAEPPGRGVWATARTSRSCRPAERPQRSTWRSRGTPGSPLERSVRSDSPVSSAASGRAVAVAVSRSSPSPGLASSLDRRGPGGDLRETGPLRAGGGGAGHAEAVKGTPVLVIKVFAANCGALAPRRRGRRPRVPVAGYWASRTPRRRSRRTTVIGPVTWWVSVWPSAVALAAVSS
jgi:hypothetical protein